MASGEIVKMTSKGQITLPAKIRRSLTLSDESHLYVTQTGDLIVLKKVDELTLDDVSALFESLAAEGGVTKEMLEADVEEARRRIAEEREAP